MIKYYFGFCAIMVLTVAAFPTGKQKPHAFVEPCPLETQVDTLQDTVIDREYDIEKLEAEIAQLKNQLKGAK